MMPRIRTIKPEFFTDERLAELPYAARIVFAGLWTQADGAGRLEDRPKFLKTQILPYDNEDMNALLESLDALGFIVRYEVGAKRYIQVSNFSKHQRITGKEASVESGFPAPGADLKPRPEPHPGNTGETTEKHRGSAECFTNVQERKGKERKGKGDTREENSSDPLPKSSRSVKNVPISLSGEVTCCDGIYKVPSKYWESEEFRSLFVDHHKIRVKLKEPTLRMYELMFKHYDRFHLSQVIAGLEQTVMNQWIAVPVEIMAKAPVVMPFVPPAKRVVEDWG